MKVESLHGKNAESLLRQLLMRPFTAINMLWIKMELPVNMILRSPSSSMPASDYKNIASAQEVILSHASRFLILLLATTLSLASTKDSSISNTMINDSVTIFWNSSTNNTLEKGNPKTSTNPYVKCNMSVGNHEQAVKWSKKLQRIVRIVSWWVRQGNFEVAHAITC